MTDRESGPLLSAGFWLHHAALTWRAELDNRLRPLGLTPTQFLLLASVGWLEHLDGPPTQQEVARQAGADRMMTSKVVRTLEERGLVDRRAHESDARALRLALTSAGRVLTRQATAVAREVDTRFFGEESEDLRAALRSVALLRKNALSSVASVDDGALGR
ncbi:MAG: ydcH [Amycolatopsis sp.]|jgi:DNA-binding MarR family transcriptional regulator|uniref:MarR family winged helix-turn-helix transcriptional regulator n=1 Tax=Amycolatopsis sp. TaxID=37632 RepID=UPI002622A0F8|nr:MarR family transcriptional regulator [Amycolatopsis sp.]MCU1685894.1 ydcH [Amycolatopsis sp.]